MQLRDEGKLRLDDPVRHTPGLKSSAATRLRDREAERLKTKSSDNREIVGEDKTHIADMLYSHL